MNLSILIRSTALSVDALATEARRLRFCAKQRDHVIATIITNLEVGASGEQVLDWWKAHGSKLLEEYPLGKDD